MIWWEMVLKSRARCDVKSRARDDVKAWVSFKIVVKLLNFSKYYVCMFGVFGGLQHII